MTNLLWARVGAVFTLLLALRSFWPPLVSWWPPFHLFWPLILVLGALLILAPLQMPPVLQKTARHPHFSALFTAIVWAHFWVYGGVFWLLAAFPLAFAFWRGDGWNWNLRAWWNGPNRVFAIGIATALLCLRLTWLQVSFNTGGYLTGGTSYGLNTYNYSTGYYEWGWQYNPLQNLMPGFSSTYDFIGAQLRGGLWATLVCFLLFLALVRSSFANQRREIAFGLGFLSFWWLYSWFAGNVSEKSGWIFPIALGALIYDWRSLSRQSSAPEKVGG